MNRKVNLVLLIIMSFIIQAYLLNKLGKEYSFLLGVPVTVSSKLFYRLLIQWYLPISFLTFYFVGETSHSLRTRGSLLITRGTSRVKWWIINLSKASGKLGLLVSIQFFVFKLISQKGYFEISMGDFEVFIRYYLMLLFFIFVQMSLELYFEPTSAHLLVNTVIVGSILMAHACFIFFPTGAYYWLFIPLNGMEANIVGIPKVSSISLISSEKSIVFLLSLHIIWFLSSLIKVKRIDIF